jgi:hypothetical protein
MVMTIGGPRWWCASTQRKQEQRIFADADFDRNFPVSCRTDELGVGRVFDELPRGGA